MKHHYFSTTVEYRVKKIGEHLQIKATESCMEVENIFE
jgi:hypothetical protein